MIMKDQARRDPRYILSDKLPYPSENRRNGMLILTRRIAESIIIGDDMHIVVLGVKGNQVRLGINAPKEISVHRDEIYKKIQLEKENGIKRN